MRIRLLVLISLIFYPFIAFADPSVTGSDSLANGEPATITGSSFGSKSSAQPIKWDTFEIYTLSQSISGVGSSPQWLLPGSNPPVADDTHAHSGSKAAYSDFPLNDPPNCSFSQVSLSFSDVTQLYVSYWVYWDTSTSADISSGDWFKMSRFNYNTPYSGDPWLKPEFWVDYGIPEGLETPRGYLQYQYGSTSAYATYKTTGGQSNAFTHGNWHRLEFWMKLSSTPGASDGDHEFLIDAQSTPLSLDSGTPGVTCPTGSTCYYNIFQMNLSGCGYTESDHPYMWLDDCYVDSTQARVEIGNASTWSACTHREIQIPTSWSNTSISITANFGSFSINDDIYIYVVDSDGAVNASGYGPVTLSGGATHIINAGSVGQVSAGSVGVVIAP